LHDLHVDVIHGRELEVTEMLSSSRILMQECMKIAPVVGVKNYQKLPNVFQKAYRQYESAMGSAAGMGDRLCHMEAMDGAARCLEALRLQQKICNCRPLEFNTRLLEVASSIGAKVSNMCCGEITVTSILGDGEKIVLKNSEARAVFYCIDLVVNTKSLLLSKDIFGVSSILQRYCQLWFMGGYVSPSSPV
jgi:hypothetical protein